MAGGTHLSGGWPVSKNPKPFKGLYHTTVPRKRRPGATGRDAIGGGMPLPEEHAAYGGRAGTAWGARWPRQP